MLLTVLNADWVKGHIDRTAESGRVDSALSMLLDGAERGTLNAHLRHT